MESVTVISVALFLFGGLASEFMISPSFVRVFDHCRHGTPTNYLPVDITRTRSASNKKRPPPDPKIQRGSSGDYFESVMKVPRVSRASFA